MRTTVDIPETLYRESEELASRLGSTVEELIVHAVAREVRAAGLAPAADAEGLADLPVIPSKRPGSMDLSQFDFDELLA